MPEYHQIQTYINLDAHGNVQPACLRITSVLSTLGWLTPELEEWVENISLHVNQDGYGGPNGPTLTVSVMDSPLTIRLWVIIWTPLTFRVLSTPCLEFEILLESNSIDDYSDPEHIRYQSDKAAAVWHIMQFISTQGFDYGVFFTHEAQVGQSYRALLTLNRSTAWQFELAIISSAYRSFFLPIAPDYQAQDHQSSLWLARRAVWDQPPWEPSSE